MADSKTSIPPWNGMSPSEWEQRKKVFQLLAAVAVTVAIIGLVIGTRAPEKRELAQLDAQGRSVIALSYSELPGQRRGPNAAMYKDAFSRLRASGPGLLDPVEQTEEQRQEVLERRKKRRAFAGAPPTIPHSVQEQNPSACLACHDKGARVAGLRAPAMSHDTYSMCTQCHAMGKEENSYVATMVGVSEEDDFEGLAEAHRGQRAFEGAPPTIPHSTFMREKCSSCHGTQGELGMRSTHPNRQNCEQCHVPAAKFDPGGPPAFGIWPPQ